jgi:hypothetical protein
MRMTAMSARTAAIIHGSFDFLTAGAIPLRPCDEERTVG